jgi:para-nitrobenzyl esterase
MGKKISKRMILNLLAIAALLAVLGGIAVYTALFNPLIFAGRSAIVRTEGGDVQGLTWRGVSVFRGIPFAAPPVGDRRWRAPEPVIPWDGVRDATRFGAVCMQAGEPVPGLGREPTSEDCLYANVWTPAEAPDARLPVMVWLYGGGMHVGSGSARLYWGDHIARKDVVVVTLNYRLGVFGMMAHPELSAEASYGAAGDYLLLDQIAALRWVQQNIEAFGGDPSNVTVFGQSAGATSISRLIVSPLARGLFRRAIAQSGGDLRGEPETVPLQEAERIGSAFGERLGAQSLGQLRALSAEEVMAADVESYFPDGTPRGFHKIAVDGYVLPTSVHEAYPEGRAVNVPLILGYNSGDDPDVHRNAGRNWAEAHARTGNPVYAYYFTKVPPYPPFRFRGIAGHGAELIYLFGFPQPIFFYAVEFPWNAAGDYAMSERMISYWTNFAKTGNPNGDGLPEWPMYNIGRDALELGDDIAPLPLADAVIIGSE